MLSRLASSFWNPGSNEPNGDQYLVYLHFDLATRPGYSTEPEFNLAASWIAERLIRLDERTSPGICAGQNRGFCSDRSVARCGRDSILAKCFN
jgi:hypothetical protein